MPVDVIPAFLHPLATPPMHYGDENLLLRLGEVQEIVYPDDERSRSKRFVEYRVLVQNASNDTANAKMYENCLLMNPLGSLADFAEFTLRADQSENKNKETGLGKGSKVLILSVNGQANMSYIIGGVRDEADERDKKVKDLGHHFYAQFNGMVFFVDKDGRLLVTREGKTGLDGKRDSGVNESTVGSSFKMLGNGNVQMADKDAKNAVTVDHENKKVLIAHEQGTEIGKATDKMPLFSTYRDAENQMHKKMFQAVVSMRAACAVMAIALAKVATALGASPAAAAAPFVTEAIGGVQQLQQAFGQFGDATNQFEAQAEKYLSRHNKND